MTVPVFAVVVAQTYFRGRYWDPGEVLPAEEVLHPGFEVATVEKLEALAEEVRPLAAEGDEAAQGRLLKLEQALAVLKGEPLEPAPEPAVAPPGPVQEPSKGKKPKGKKGGDLDSIFKGGE